MKCRYEQCTEELGERAYMLARRKDTQYHSLLCGLSANPQPDGRTIKSLVLISSETRTLETKILKVNSS